MIFLNSDRKCLPVCHIECRKYFPPHCRDLWKLTHVVRRLIKTKAVCNQRKATLKCTQTQRVRVTQCSLRQVVFKVAAFLSCKREQEVSGLTAAAGQAHPMQNQCAHAWTEVYLVAWLLLQVKLIPCTQCAHAWTAVHLVAHLVAWLLLQVKLIPCRHNVLMHLVNVIDAMLLDVSSHHLPDFIVYRIRWPECGRNGITFISWAVIM